MPSNFIETYRNFKNLDYFLNFGVYPPLKSSKVSPIVDYYFYFSISNTSYINQVDVESLFKQYSKKFYNPMINIILHFGENLGSDFCSNSKMLSQYNIDYNQYNYAMFINCGVRGPIYEFKEDLHYSKYGPHYKNLKEHFLIQFQSMLVGNVKIAGPLINCYKTDNVPPHVQSYTMIIASEVFHIAFPFIKCYDSFMSTVWDGEILLSETLINKGYNIADRRSVNKNREFKKNWQNDNILNSDLYYNPLETIFYKNGGNLFRLGRVLKDEENLEFLTNKQMKMTGREYDQYFIYPKNPPLKN